MLLLPVSKFLDWQLLEGVVKMTCELECAAKIRVDVETEMILPAED